MSSGKRRTHAPKGAVHTCGSRSAWARLERAANPLPGTDRDPLPGVDPPASRGSAPRNGSGSAPGHGSTREPRDPLPGTDRDPLPGVDPPAPGRGATRRPGIRSRAWIHPRAGDPLPGTDLDPLPGVDPPAGRGATRRPGIRSRAWIHPRAGDPLPGTDRDPLAGMDPPARRPERSESACGRDRSVPQPLHPRKHPRRQRGFHLPSRAATQLGSRGTKRTRCRTYPRRPNKTQRCARS